MRFISIGQWMLGATVVIAGLAAAPAQAAGVPGMGTWETTLQARDLDGNGVTDAFYDTEFDVTWLRDATAGPMTWSDASTWASSLAFGGYSDWRLPNSDQCQGYDCTASEMGHLWYGALGNVAPGPMNNTGGFENLVSDVYWSGTLTLNAPTSSQIFNTQDGSQYGYYVLQTYYATAVRTGDISLVPEPETYALMLAGLAGMALLAPAKHHRRN